MRNNLNIRKARAAAAYVVARNGGGMDLLWLVKILYAAERKALLAWERPIIGDSLCSLPMGPVVSRTYNLMNGKGPVEWVAFWEEEFKERNGNRIQRRAGAGQPDVGPLSRREITALDEAFDELAHLDAGQLIDKMHKCFPEWKDPHGGSKPIPYEEILLQSERSKADISAILEEIESVQLAHRRLGRKLAA
jgi:uncharacterized phage-associated protein